jgi:hypothetical protein
VIRRSAEGCKVARVIGAHGDSKISPRERVTRKAGPSSDRAALAPSTTSASGRSRPISDSSQGLHAVISPALGLAWMRRFPRGVHLKCFTALVTYASDRSMPARPRSSSSSRPAGPTKGRPVRSSSSPGCSPTSTTRALTLPSPNTVCVASL